MSPSVVMGNIFKALASQEVGCHLLCRDAVMDRLLMPFHHAIHNTVRALS